MFVVEIKNDEEGKKIRLQGSMSLSMNWQPFTVEDGRLIINPQ